MKTVIITRHFVIKFLLSLAVWFGYLFLYEHPQGAKELENCFTRCAQIPTVSCECGQPPSLYSEMTALLWWVVVVAGAFTLMTVVDEFVIKRKHGQ